MSHFSVAVFTDGHTTLEELLEPYAERVEPCSPYAEFEEDEDADYDEIAERKGYWYNPNARWDWWDVGGRWRGFLKLLPGGNGARVPLNPRSRDFVYPEGRCDSAPAADCDFSRDEKIYRKALQRWEVIVDGAKPRSDEEFPYPFHREYYLKRYGDREIYARWTASRLPHAFVTADGEWREQGKMGWFGCDDATRESMAAYEGAFLEYLEDAKRRGLTITIVDCHI